MCLIVDANCASETFGSPPSDAFRPVIEALQAGSAVMVYGGTKLKQEYRLLPRAWRIVVMLDRAGKAIAYSDSAIDAKQDELVNGGLLVSDDPHIIALAVVSSARLLCSRDKNLHTDFTSPKLINKPRGSVYQNEKHIALLKKCHVTKAK